jgi:hypothetical protein
LISVVYFYPTYSYSLLVLGYPWAITAPLFMLMLAINFRKSPNKGNNSTTRNQPLQTPYKKTPSTVESIVH